MVDIESWQPILDSALAPLSCWIHKSISSDNHSLWRLRVFKERNYINRSETALCRSLLKFHPNTFCKRRLEIKIMLLQDSAGFTLTAWDHNSRWITGGNPATYVALLAPLQRGLVECWAVHQLILVPKCSSYPRWMSLCSRIWSNVLGHLSFIATSFSIVLLQGLLHSQTQIRKETWFLSVTKKQPSLPVD